jgi:hypothetical protein
MLRVSYSDTADGQRWSLCGRLAGPWVEELRACWRQARERAPRAGAIVDLKDVTFVDEDGERLLAEMQAAGTEFIAGGVENKHLVAGLRNKDKGLRERRAARLSAPWGGPKALKEASSEKDTES